MAVSENPTPCLICICIWLTYVFDLHLYLTYTCIWLTFVFDLHLYLIHICIWLILYLTCICTWLVFVFQHLIVWRSGWLFGQTCFNWNLKWVCWYRRGAFSQLLHPALRTLQWLRYLDENAKIRPHLNTSKNTLLERQ